MVRPDKRSSVGFGPDDRKCGLRYRSPMEPSDRFDIVRINQRNVDVLGVVADDVFDDEINDDLLQAVLDNGQLLLTAIVDGAVVGQLQAMVQHHLDGAPQLYIDNLGVSPLHQRGASPED